MISATLISHDGRRHQLVAESGTSLMHAAVAAGIEGIVGDCGGNISCATCHVIVSPDHAPLLEPMSPNEDQMLDCTAAPRQYGSRLSCQIVLQERIDGITVRIAHPQL